MRRCSSSAGSRTRWGVAAFLGVYTLTFTTFLTHPSGIYGLWTGLDYWLGQHGVGRGGESPVFYSVVLFAHEWPVLAARASSARSPRSGARRCCGCSSSGRSCVSLIVYSWAGEKFAWLVLHPLLPLILLAGVGLQELWASRRTLPGKLGARGDRAGARLHGLRVRARQRGPPRRPARVPRLHPVLDRRRRRGAPDRRAGRAPRRQAEDLVDSAEGATFPWAWYFRDLDVGYLDLSTTGEPPVDSDVIILTQASNTRLQPTLTGYDGAPDPLPRLVGARLRQGALPRRLVALVQRARAVEPDRRDAGVGLRAAGRLRRRLAPCERQLTG